MARPSAVSIVGFIASFTALVVLASCRDPLKVEPAGAQSADLARIQASLDAVMAKLDTVRAELGEEVGALSADVAAIGTTLEALGGEVGAGVSAGAYTQVEGSVCVKSGFSADVGFNSGGQLDGQAVGTLGLDGYGNGGKGRLIARAVQRIEVEPKGGLGLEVQVCGKLVGEVGLDAGATITLSDSDALTLLLQDLLNQVSMPQISSAASARNMNGVRLSQGLNALSTLSMAQLPFGSGGGSAGQLMDALPLPEDIRALATDPAGLLDDALGAAQYATDQLCGQALRVGDFAALVAAGCDLRDEAPSPATVIDIFNGLDGLPTTLTGLQSSIDVLEGSMASVQSGLGNVCTTLGNVTQTNLTIPSRTIEILGQSYTTFPGYSARLFPGMARPSC